MRDNQIYEMNKRRADNDVLLYKQLNFLNTRIQAYEEVMSSRKAILRAIWDPEWLRQAVDKIQLALLRVYDEKIRELEKKSKISVLR